MEDGVVERQEKIPMSKTKAKTTNKTKAELLDEIKLREKVCGQYDNELASLREELGGAIKQRENLWWDLSLCRREIEEFETLVDVLKSAIHKLTEENKSADATIG